MTNSSALFAAGLAAVVVAVWARSVRRRKERAQLAARWEWIQQEREARRPEGLHLV